MKELPDVVGRIVVATFVAILGIAVGVTVVVLLLAAIIEAIRMASS